MKKLLALLTAISFIFSVSGLAIAHEKKDKGKKDNATANATANATKPKKKKAEGC